MEARALRTLIIAIAIAIIIIIIIIIIIRRADGGPRLEEGVGVLQRQEGVREPPPYSYL